MNKLVFVFVTAVALGGCSPSLPQCSSADPRAIASALYGREQFRAMLTNVAKSTVTGKMVAEKDPAGFEKRLSSAVEHALDRYGGQWDANLAQAYSDTLTKEELMSLCAAMNENDKASFGRFAERVGPDMKSKSAPLLQKAGLEVVKELFEGQPAK
ncbi:MAG: hypothetical protein VYA35_10990 [Pseudomonadota bacterium]|nr:hypothetical protein [Pseudomonadota bacterium]